MQNLNWKWVGIGAVIIIGLNQLWGRLLAEPLGFPLMMNLGIYGGLIAFALIVALLSFFVGGIVVGRLSEGESVREAAFASIAAIVVGVVINVVQTGRFPGVLSIVIAAALGYGLGFAGAKVGQKMRGKPAGAPTAPPGGAPGEGM
ncbi:MAG: hypothetical protein JRJ19_16865 [Deltaproteobacteria bacterium]|nr:hypothetical protein [Deltaproteobacteria bacterium]MBW1873736.1 hypothetical protein [Deltaproteobacteria bacterium]